MHSNLKSDIQQLPLKSMKTLNSNQFSPLIAQILKLVGLILVVAFLLDFIVLLFPFRLQDKGWQVSFVTQIVDRGTIPMVGLAFLLIGYWINNSDSNSPNSWKSWLNLRSWALLISSILGLIFLLLIPLHINNVLQARTQALQRINQEVSQAETQLQTQIEGQQNQFRTQISNLLQNEQQFNQALQSNQVPEQFKTLLRQAKANPAALDQLLAQQLNAETIRNQGRAEIQRRKQEVEQKAQEEVWQTGVRIGIRSLLLSLGYIVIGWTGLRGMRQPK